MCMDCNEYLYAFYQIFVWATQTCMTICSVVCYQNFRDSTNYGGVMRLTCSHRRSGMQEKNPYSISHTPKDRCLFHDKDTKEKRNDPKVM